MKISITDAVPEYQTSNNCRTRVKYLGNSDRYKNYIKKIAMYLVKPNRVEAKTQVEEPNGDSIKYSKSHDSS